VASAMIDALKRAMAVVENRKYELEYCAPDYQPQAAHNLAFARDTVRIIVRGLQQAIMSTLNVNVFTLLMIASELREKQESEIADWLVGLTEFSGQKAFAESMITTLTGLTFPLDE